MSALAQALLDAGFRVTGSDRYFDQGASLEILDILRRAGVELVPQDGAWLRADTQALVVSTAIEEGNPELEAARRLGVPVVHRAAMLARLAAGHDLIAITGTAGKTTVTGMVGRILEQAGCDPAVVNGGIVLDWQSPDRVGSVRKGAGRWWVIEADESDRSLVNFSPRLAVITNVSKDHFELDEVCRIFQRFAASSALPPVLGPEAGRVLGLPENPRAFQPVHRDGAWSFELDGRVYRTTSIGRHNAENAFMAVCTALALGLEPEAIQAGLLAFKGIHRRLELTGVAGGVAVIDDYAHNPAKIAASWRAVAESHPRVLGFWRPHGFGPLALMRQELTAAWKETCRPDDLVAVLPVYYVGGTAKMEFTSRDFVEQLCAAGVPAVHVASYEELGALLCSRARAGDAVLGMGARDPELPQFSRKLLARLR